MFSRLDIIPACERQTTDIQTARHFATAIAALCYASRVQKPNFLTSNIFVNSWNENISANDIYAGRETLKSF